VNFYETIFRALGDEKIHYIIVGGVAMNLLGYPRFTGDIDILLALDENNLQKMAKIMKELGYETRLPLAIDELGDEKKAVQLIKEKNLIAFTYVNPKEPQYNIDIIVGPSLQFQYYEAHCLYKTIWSLSLPIISIDDLIALKQESNREKDAEDIVNLLELKHL
jgi:hypothetical protein